MMGPDAAPLPQLSLWGAAFWAVQVALGWRAFALLPSSHKKGQRVRFERRARLPFASRLALAAGDADAPTNMLGNGGGTPFAQVVREVLQGVPDYSRTAVGGDPLHAYCAEGRGGAAAGPTSEGAEAQSSTCQMAGRSGAAGRAGVDDVLVE